MKKDRFLGGLFEGKCHTEFNNKLKPVIIISLEYKIHAHLFLVLLPFSGHFHIC